MCSALKCNMASSSLLGMGEEYVLPSSNSSKPFQYLLEVIGLDHCYCKPWSSLHRVPNPRPVKTLFLRDADQSVEAESKRSKEKKAEESFIDVVSVDDGESGGPKVINMQYDVMKAKAAMAECEKYVSSASSRRTPDTWEELICRTGWNNHQNVLFDKILKIVSSYRLARLTYEGSPNEPVLRRVTLDKATKRVRQILSRIQWDPALTTWLHSSMVDGLSIPLLACYLDIMQTLRSKVPSLVDKMIASTAPHRRVSPGTTDNMTSLLKRPWDATIGLSSFQRQRKVSGPPLLLIVPSGPTTSLTGTNSKRSRFWHHHLSNLGKVIPVTMHLSNSGRGVSIGQCLDHMIGAVQAKVLELKNHFPNRPVVLIGWSTGALVSFQVSLKESVCAVVCLGFPLLGVEGRRGDPNDPFLESKTPTMFVFGSLSSCCSLPDIEEFRRKLFADTSVLLIGGADGQLRLTSSKKKIEGVTQSMVDRRIMDEIGEFLGTAVSAMNNMQTRTDYFDFDDIENRRKKPKTEKRKRSAGDGKRSAGDGTTGAVCAKKPKSKATKPVTSRVQGSGAKKTKPVKNIKQGSLNKPIVVAGPPIVPGPPPARPTSSVPISALRGGIIQGVNVPLSGVSVPLPGVTVPVSGISVPVSAVIKQGSLGGRSFVFSCPQPNNSGVANSAVVNSAVGCSSPVTVSSGVVGSGQQLKIVMESSPAAATKVSGQQNLPAVTSSLGQHVQYNSGTAISGVSSGTPSTSTAKIVASAGVTSSSTTTSVSQTVLTPSTVTSTGITPSSVTTSNMSSTNVISSNVTSSLVTSSNVTLSNAASSKEATSSVTMNSVPLKQISGNSSVTKHIVSYPKSAVVPPSGQAQFIMRGGQLSAVNKPNAIRMSSPSTVPNLSGGKSVASSQAQRDKTVSNGKQQQSATTSDTISKQSVVRVEHASSKQAPTTLVRRTPSPQNVTRPIQVGVKDPKKPAMVKRTVTYTPTTTTKTINAISRSGTTSVVAAMVTRVGTPGGNIQSVTQLKNSATTASASRQSTNAQPGSAHLIKQSVTTPSFSMQAKSLQRASAQLVSASLATARSLAASAGSASSVSGQKLSAQTPGSQSLCVSQTARSMARYHEDEKLVEKIRGIVKDVVNSTPRTKQRIVVTTKSTVPSSTSTSAGTTVTKPQGSKKLTETETTDGNSKK